METKIRRRRPAFDREHGVAIAQALFHERGYDAVGVAELTKALDINPPSLYAAYGSKAELFDRAMRRYIENNMLDIDKLPAASSEPAVLLTELFVAAAIRYTENVKSLGCMVTEGLGADDETARNMAAELAKVSSDKIRTYVAARYPGDHEKITDYVLLTLRGISSFARQGSGQERLMQCARIAGRALEGDASF